MVLEYILNNKTFKIIKHLIKNNSISPYNICKETNISYERVVFWLSKLENANFLVIDKQNDNKIVSLNTDNPIIHNLINLLELDRVSFTDNFMFAINELMDLKTEEPIQFLIGEPFNIGHWSEYPYTSYPLEVYSDKTEHIKLKYDCIKLIKQKDQDFYKNGIEITNFGIKFKILSLEDTLITSIKKISHSKISNSRLALALLSMLDRDINWNILYGLAIKNKIERKLGYFLELKNLITQKNENKTFIIPPLIWKRLEFKKDKKIRFNSKYFFIQHRLNKQDPYCILGLQWGIFNPLTEEEIHNKY